MDKELNILGHNMHVFHKIVALLLLVLTSQSVLALKGSGTSNDPYIIESLQDLTDLKARIDGKTYRYVKQTKDIDVSTATTTNNVTLPLTCTYSQMSGFKFEKYFYGEYDGDGHSLTGWSLPKGKRCGTNAVFYMSIFGKLGNKDLPQKSVVKNLTIDGAVINLPDNTKDGWDVGFIAGYSENASIENCHVKNSTVTGNGGVVFGALCAYNKGTIENCSVINTTFRSLKQSRFVGSFCGDNAGNLKNCKAMNVSLMASSYIGGLVGSLSNNATVESCSFYGYIGPSTSGDGKLENVGGLGGRLVEGSFINCFSVFSNAGLWKSAGQVGGLIGLVDETSKSATVKNCYSFPQIVASQFTDADIVVGRDPKREDPSRVFESCYCYEYSFGEKFTTSYTAGNKAFSEDYKTKHQIGISSSDFMRSGCFAEVLTDYHNNHLSGENPWREDVELQNDTLPVLKFMVNDAYDSDPFCHPVIFTMSHSENGNVSNLNGKIKYITDDQNTDLWEHGIEVKVGNESWVKLNEIINEPLSATVVDFYSDYTFSKSKTTVYRAYTCLKSNKTQKAYGKVDTIWVATSTVPDTITGCDSLKYDGRIFYYPVDNGTYTNKAGDEVIIKLGHNFIEVLPEQITTGECGETSINVQGKLFEKPGYYEVSSEENFTGCTTTSYANIKLYPTITKDSIKIFGLGEKSYTYNPVGGDGPKTIEAGKDYVTTPKFIMTDRVKYKEKPLCDSLALNVSYVIPIKYSYAEDKTWSCEPREYNGVVYDKDTILVDTIITKDASVAGGYLYEIKTYHVKVKVAKTVEDTILKCGEIDLSECCGCTPDFDDPDKCFTKEPFDITTVVKSKLCDCDSIIYLTHYTIGEKPTLDTSVVSCGPYTYEYKGKKTTWKKSGDYKVIRSGTNFGACDNETIVTFHVTINESVSYNDTTIHGCGRVVYRTLSGEAKIFNETQDFIEEIQTPGGCNSSRTVHVYVHKKQDKSQLFPITGCAPYIFKRLNGDSVVLEKGTHIFNDTLRSKDDCGCDSIVKTTTIILDEPTILQEKIVTGCNEVKIGDEKFTKDTSFVVEQQGFSLLKYCQTQFQPYKVVINASSVEYFNVDTCGTYRINGETLKKSGRKEFTIPSENGCDNKQIYDIRIIEPTEIDSVVYACDSYDYTFFDGHNETVNDDGFVIVDYLKSKVCLCDSVIRKVKVYISHDDYEVLPKVKNCGPYTYVKKSNGQKVLVEKTQIVRDTLVTKYGCHIYYETEVEIIPVVTTIKTLDECKVYHSEVPVWNYGNRIVDIELETPEVQTAELIFLTENTSYSECMDTTKLFLTVHGVGTKSVDIVECDTFEYTDFKNTKLSITSDTLIVDTLKSAVCDCDSIIRTTKVKINHSVPESLRETIKLRACDSVVYKNAKGIDMIFKKNIQFQDTFQMKSTGCDSVVIVDVQVPKSTGSVKILTACGDTTLFDTLNNNFPHFFDKSDVWHQNLGMNEEGCEHFMEWQVNITPTPRDTHFTTGCGEIEFGEEVYTSENEKVSTFSVVLNGDTKCDTIHNYFLTVYPKYYGSVKEEGCGFVEWNGKTYNESIIFQDTMLSRYNCDSIINVNIIVNKAYDEKDIASGCNEVKFVDEDYNGGKPVFVHSDSTIYVDKFTDKGCKYQFIQKIIVNHPAYIETEYFERYDIKNGYATYLDLNLTSDTLLLDTVDSENKCGTVLASKITLLMPVYKTNNVYTCLDEELGYATFRDFKLTSDTIVYDTISSINNNDTVIINNINLIKPYADTSFVFSDTIFGCDSVKFVDVDYNGGLPVTLNHDTIISIDKTAGHGCPYQLVNLIEIGHHSDSLNYVVECYDTQLEYATYRGLHLTADTIIYDTISSENRCGTVITNKIHLNMPDIETNSEFLCYDSRVGYAVYGDLHLKSDTIIFDTIANDNVCGKVVENRIHLITSGSEYSTYVDSLFGCEEVTYLDADYNGGNPATFTSDAVVNLDKHTEDGCEYKVELKIQVGHHSDSTAYWTKYYDSKLGYASYRDLQLTNDSIIYDTIVSKNRCGTIVTNNINVVMPIHDTIYLDSCLRIKYKGLTYSESDTVVTYTKTAIGRDSFTHAILNVEKCFPYPVLVNKYNWILVCNDIIFDEDRFKVKSNVKYKWYKNDALVSTSSDSYFTEDKVLNGCYQVGIILEDGSEYLSDLVCIDDKHGYTISPQPNPVEKMQAVTIVCDFPEEGVEGTVVEVFNMNAEKVYVSTAKSDDIVIPGMSASGYYLVRLTTVTGKVLTAKYVVK